MVHGLAAFPLFELDRSQPMTQPLTGTATAHIYVAIIGVPCKAMAPALQLLIHFIEQPIGQQRRHIYRLVKHAELHLIKIGSTASSGITAVSINAMIERSSTPDEERAGES